MGFVHRIRTRACLWRKVSTVLEAVTSVTLVKTDSKYLSECPMCHCNLKTILFHWYNEKIIA